MAKNKSLFWFILVSLIVAAGLSLVFSSGSNLQGRLGSPVRGGKAPNLAVLNITRASVDAPLVVTVVNSSVMPVEEEVTLTFAVNGEVRETETARAIPAGGKYEWDTGVVLPDGSSYTVVAFVDSENVIPEASEVDNKLIREIQLVDLTISDYGREPGTNNVWFTVKNIGDGDLVLSDESVQITGWQHYPSHEPSQKFMSDDVFDSHTLRAGGEQTLVMTDLDTSYTEFSFCVDRITSATPGSTDPYFEEGDEGYEGLIMEENEANNCATDIRLENLPDLRVDYLTYDVSLSEAYFRYFNTHLSDDPEAEYDSFDFTVYVNEEKIANFSEPFPGSPFRDDELSFDLEISEDSTIKLCIDEEGRYDERDEENNCTLRDVVFLEVDFPDLVPTRISPSSQHVYIDNTGDIDIDADIYTRYEYGEVDLILTDVYLDDELIHTFGDPDIVDDYYGAQFYPNNYFLSHDFFGESMIEASGLPAFRHGDRTVKVCVDTLNIVTESNEDNNCLEFIY
ncbi:hypothetical protein HOH67_00420 [Candidatus Peregrinibacteria bacterium]|nr:hypothetical protein [Candidatus Peregrinibacteria bacterium]MBT5823579.1 hypothetical protein [Candidatus Peregrinibacteria bacterium]